MVHVLLIFLRVIDARAFLMRTPTISNILIYFFIFFLKKKFTSKLCPFIQPEKGSKLSFYQNEILQDNRQPY